MKYQITDRLSFQRFLGISLGDKVPDAKTIWLYNEMLRQSGALSVLFAMFNSYLEAMGIITHKGTIADATFVDAPKQRNSKDENDSVKKSETPEEWADEPRLQLLQVCNFANEEGCYGLAMPKNGKKSIIRGENLNYTTDFPP